MSTHWHPCNSDDCHWAGDDADEICRAEAERIRSLLQAAHLTCRPAEAAGLLTAVEIVARGEL